MRTPRQQALVSVGLLVAIGVLLRVPSLALPLGAADARLLEAADALGRGDLAPLARAGPLVPALVAFATALGLDGVTALRLLALVGGALAPGVLWLLARRLALPPLGAGLAALLFALHPLWIAHAGGPEAGTLGVGVSLVLGAWLGTRASLALAFLGVLAAPLLWPHALLLLGAAASGAAARPLGRALLVTSALWGLFAVVLAGGVRSSSVPGAVVGLALLAGLPLALLLPRGVRALAAPGRAARCLVAVAALQAGLAVAGLGGSALHLGWDGLAAFAPCVGVVALLAAAGTRLPAHPGDRRLAVAGLALLAPLTLFAALAPAQHALLAERAPLGGRLHALGAAARLAATEAGPEGWVALDLGAGTAAEARALAPFLGGRPLLVTPASGGGSTPPRDWPPGGPITLSLLTVRPEPGRVTTLGGWGIYAQEPAGRVGTFHVRRIRRP
jgi:hypothetical protein